MLRRPDAVDFVIDLISKDHAGRAAISALAIRGHSESIRERVAPAVASLNNSDLTAWFEKKFSVPPEKH
jgi:hypothetical protein